MLLCRQPSIVLFLFSSAYIVFLCIYGRQEFTDELYFKIAGLNWATKGTFNAPELVGMAADARASVDELFFLYMPLYSFLFGVFVKIFGFGWLQVILYDALIHLALVWTVYKLTKCIYELSLKDYPKYIIVIPAILILPIGQVGRPDELAMLFGYLGLYFLIGNNLTFTNLTFSAFLFGLCALTSSPVALILGVIYFCLIYFRPKEFLIKIKLLSFFGFIFLLVFLAGLAISLHKNPTAYEQFLIISSLFTPQFDQRYFFANMIKYGSNYLVIILISLLLMLIYFKYAKRKTFVFKLTLLWLSTLLSTVLVFILFPIKYTYLWFTIPILIILIIATINSVKQHKKVFVFSLALCLLASPIVYAKPLQHYLIQFSLEKNQTIRFNEGFVLNNITPDSTVVVQRGWWYLADKNYQLLDSMFSNSNKLAEIDYIVLTANGSGKPGVPHLPVPQGYRNILATDFEQIANNLKKDRNELFSIPLSNSGNGHGVVIYKRK